MNTETTQNTETQKPAKQRRVRTKTERLNRCKTDFGFWVLAQPKPFIKTFCKEAKVNLRTLWSIMSGGSVRLVSFERVWMLADSIRVQMFQPRFPLSAFRMQEPTPVIDLTLSK